MQGKADALVDGDVSYQIAFETMSADPEFNGLAPQRITVKNTDDPTNSTTTTP